MGCIVTVCGQQVTAAVQVVGHVRGKEDVVLGRRLGRRRSRVSVFGLITLEILNDTIRLRPNLVLCTTC